MKSKSNYITYFILSIAILSNALFAGTIVDQAIAPNLHTYVIVSLPLAL